MHKRKQGRKEQDDLVAPMNMGQAKPCGCDGRVSRSASGCCALAFAHAPSSSPFELNLEPLGLMDREK